MAEISQSLNVNGPKIKRLSTENHSINTRFIKWVRFIATIWLLCYYLLPNTYWSRWSPGEIFFDENAWIRLQSGERVATVATIIFGIATTILLAFRSWQCTDGKSGGIPSGNALWFWLSVYLIPGYATLAFHHGNPELTHSVESIIAAVCCGVLAALICGDFQRLAQAICILAFIQAAYTIYYVHAGINAFPSGNVLRAGGTFDHPDGVYTLMLVGLPLAIALSLRATQRSSTLYLISASAIFSALLLTWFRGGMIAASVSLTWLVYKLSNKPRLALITAVSMLSLCFIVASHRSFGSINQASTQRSTAGHVILWKRGILVFENNWISGMGIGALSIPLTIDTGEPDKQRPSIQIEPKNVFLFFLDELGLTGGILVVALIVGCIRTYKAGSHDIPIQGMTAAWLAIIVAGVFDTPFGPSDRYCGNALLGCTLGAMHLLWVTRQQNRMDVV